MRLGHGLLDLVGGFSERFPAVANHRGELKHFLYAAIIAVVFYSAAFYGCEHLRTAKGPWQVEFGEDENRHPRIVIDQPSLRLTNVQIVFLGKKLSATWSNQTVAFSSPTNRAPFGKVIFIDTTFLPGTLTLSIFDHEIELLPRVLVIDRRERQWRSNDRIELPP